MFRINVAADSRGFVTLDTILFKVTTADDGDAWANCDDAWADEDMWDFYDTDDSSTKLDEDAGGASWDFMDSAGGNCTAGEDLRYAELDLDVADEGAQEIGAGETVTYVLRADTTGADSGADDSVRIDIPDESEADDLGAFDAISWEDDSEGVGAGADDDDDGGDIDGEFLDELPVTGGTIVY